MRATQKKISQGTVGALVCLVLIATRALAGFAVEEFDFSIPRNQSQSYVKQLVIKSPGRIVLDVTFSPKDVEITVQLRRPDGSVVSRISSSGGNLSLTYFATDRDVNGSAAGKNYTWSAEISRRKDGNTVTGKLKITHSGS
jgi:hypothetical protein